MIRPILAYGHSILRQKCRNIDQEYPMLDQLVADMWETMENANGCGLAAPQIGLPIKLFVVDSKTTFDKLGETEREIYFDPADKGIKETFINAVIIEASPNLWEDEEGCLSIPSLTKSVKRHWTIKIAYYNQDFEYRTKAFSGTTARMVQHEYDHTEGILYLDHLKPLTRKLMDGKLKKITKGQLKQGYPMKFV